MVQKFLNIKSELPHFINDTRIKNYPRVIAIVTWVIVIINVLFRKGWVGGIGGLIGFDFLTFYAIGQIYWSDNPHLYDFITQFRIEQEIFLPTSLGGGGNMFSYPPYVALAASVFNLLPYDAAYFLWTGCSLLLIILAVSLIHKFLVRKELVNAGLSAFQLFIIVISFPPVVIGLIMGQNNALTLFLLTGIIVFSLREKWIPAGIFAGLLIYKPHYVLGIVLVWLIWRKYKALTAFFLVASTWLISVVLTHGWQPYIDYLNTIPALLYLPYGVGRFVEVTVFALAVTSFPMEFFSQILVLNQLILIFASIGIAWVAYKTRTIPIQDRKLGLILILLYPFFVAPHILIHDLVILILVFALWSQIKISRIGLYTVIFTYLVSYPLQFITFPTGIALLALIPIVVFIAILFDCRSSFRIFLMKQD